MDVSTKKKRNMETISFGLVARGNKIKVVDLNENVLKGTDRLLSKSYNGAMLHKVARQLDQKPCVLLQDVNIRTMNNGQVTNQLSHVEFWSETSSTQNEGLCCRTMHSITFEEQAKNKGREPVLQAKSLNDTSTSQVNLENKENQLVLKPKLFKNTSTFEGQALNENSESLLHSISLQETHTLQDQTQSTTDSSKSSLHWQDIELNSLCITNQPEAGVSSLNFVNNDQQNVTNLDQFHDQCQINDDDFHMDSEIGERVQNIQNHQHLIQNAQNDQSECIDKKCDNNHNPSSSQRSSQRSSCMSQNEYQSDNHDECNDKTSYSNSNQDEDEDMSHEDDSEGSMWNASDTSVDSSECDCSDNDDVEDQVSNEVLRNDASRLSVDLPNISGLSFTGFDKSAINFNSTSFINNQTTSVLSDNQEKDPDYICEEGNKNKTPTNQTNNKSTSTNSNTNDLNKSNSNPCNSSNSEPVRAPNFDILTVPVSKTTEGPRIRLKHYCEYCMKDQTHLKRHLLRKHKNEVKVQQMYRLTSTNEGSRKPMKELIHSGDFQYNTKENLNNGDLRIVKSSRNEHEATDYLPCTKCKGMMLISNYTTHLKKCAGLCFSNSHDGIKMGRRILPACYTKTNRVLRQFILINMRRDRIYRAIRYDPLIIEYGNEISGHLRGQQHKANICTQLRRLARIKVELQVGKENLENLSTFLVANKSEEFVTVIEKLANGGQIAEERLLKPTVAQNMGTLVKAVCNTQMIMYIKENSHELRQEVKDFLECFGNDYKRRLSRLASESHGERRRHRNLEMPSVENIKSLLEYLFNLRVTYFNELQNQFTEQNYLYLLKVTLTSLQVYNRRRPGDVERITLDDWKCLKKIDQTTTCNYSDLNDGLQDLAQEYGLLYARGKLGRDIKLLVTPDIYLCICKLIEHRHELDISSKNRYLFALPQTPLNTVRHPSAYVLLRKFASESGIPNAILMTATRLRKQLATACVRLNLTDSGLSDLARYMGHHPNVHRSHYRQNIVDRDIPTFLKFLNTALEYNTDEILEKGIAEYAPVDEDSVVNENTIDDHINKENKGEDVSISTSRSLKEQAKTRSKWTDEERKIAFTKFENYMRRRGKAPTLKQILEMQEQHKHLFKGRNAKSIKTYLYLNRDKL